ncbi:MULTISPECIES: hypothetical protein [Hwangdonia]|uniref:Uncharacterized protein n=1 Tax=Hwangdonia seohaensis TaxID=1240727 RepID=A0ABW3RE19_9FLAO|nr:hypothetical protein [Hwangdonia seohaensis]
MENKKLNSNVFSDSVMENIQTLSDMSMQFYGTMLENVLGNNTQVNKQIGQLGKNALDPIKAILNSDDCCAPKEKCPPHCIASINRKAMAGERIIIPFVVKNNCQKPKTYKIGARELKDQDGKLATAQPLLNKNSVSLQPNTSERVLISLDLVNFKDGVYTAEIVLREKEYNQNICLTVSVGDHSAPIVTPYEEKKFKLKWQSWKSHFYCEPKERATTRS